jgi:hypothetical protein
MATATIVLWNHEPIYQSPASKTFSVMWEGELVRANVSIDVDPNWATAPIGTTKYVDRIVMNGTTVNWYGDANDVIVFDAKPYIRKGLNIIEIYHNFRIPFGIIPIQTAGCYAFIVLESIGTASGNVVEGGGLGGILGNMWWVILVVVLVLFLVIVLRR